MRASRQDLLLGDRPRLVVLGGHAISVFQLVRVVVAQKHLGIPTAICLLVELLNCDLAEAQRAFFNAPCRDAERRFHNHVMDLLEEAADHDA
ncbi:hypothetical protein RPQ02_31510 [Streptomyces sp. AM2-3-1]|uniref:hypothetical protein n=1 Tax=Streptomyces sp. AM2-3-1 TaxID=3075824 RepID=UPI0028C4E4D9|nr:hypothetical protein [Streptomyces sp. AM2-3-1]WNO68025.1 hypothetical protein RPQ02_31510 [Streptomyces sp. AM2-3-1]